VVFRSTAAEAEPRRYYPPDRWYKAGRSVLETDFLNAGREPRVDRPEDMKEYFERLYRAGQSLDEQGVQDARRRLEFATVAEKFRLIDDETVAVVVASWEGRQEEVAALLAAVRAAPTRSNFRRLAPFQVNLRRYELPQAGGEVVDDGHGVLVWWGGYDSETGVTATNTDALLLA
jgi:CRISPR-associated endonuclease/helicase Cas3